MVSIFSRRHLAVSGAVLALATMTSGAALAGTGARGHAANAGSRDDWAPATAVNPIRLVAPDAVGEHVATAWIVGSFKTNAVEYLLLARRVQGQQCVLLAERAVSNHGQPNVIQQSCDGGAATKPFVTQVRVSGGGTLLLGGAPSETAAVEATTGRAPATLVTRPARTSVAPSDTSIRFFTLLLPSQVRAVNLGYLGPDGRVRSTDALSVTVPAWQLPRCGHAVGEARCPQAATSPR